MAPIIVNQQEKRELIFEAARCTFSQKGFHQATMSEIAQLANIGKGTIYEYFPSKKELFFELCFYLFENFRDSYLKKISSLNLGVEDRIKEFIHLSLSEIEKVESFYFVFLEGYLEISKEKDKNSAVFKKLQRMYSDYRKLLSSSIQEGIKEGKFKRKINARHFASIILATLDGLASHWLSDPRLFSLNQMKKSLTKMILDSFKVVNPLKDNKKRVKSGRVKN